jgi:hypothetical protein
MFGQSMLVGRVATTICKNLGMDKEDAKAIGLAAKCATLVMTMDVCGAILADDDTIDKIAEIME